MIGLTAAQALEQIKAGDLDAADLWNAYRERAEQDDLNCFTWVSDAAEPEVAGVPIGVKDLFCTEGIPSQAGSRILEG